MRAAFIVAPRQFEIREIPAPEITDGQMLVKIEACGVCSSDMSGYKDSWPEEMKKANPFPRRAGHEPAGTVVEVGRLVRGFNVGDRSPATLPTTPTASTWPSIPPDSPPIARTA